MIQIYPTSANLSREEAPSFVATGTALLIAGLAAAGGSAATGIVAAHKQANAQQQANTLQSQAEDKQRAYLEQQAAQDQKNFETTQDLNRSQYDSTAAETRRQYDETEQLNLDQYNREEARQAPFNEQSAAKNRALAYWLNLDQQHGESYINLQPPPAQSHSGAYGGGGGGSQGVPITPALHQKILDNYKALGLTPTGEGTGPTDSAYFARQYAATGGSTPDNDSYWFGPNGRIAQEARKSGLTFKPTPPVPPKTLATVVPPPPPRPPATLSDVDSQLQYRV